MTRGGKVQRTGSKKKKPVSPPVTPVTNPCPHSPATPTGVVFHAQAREARTHLTFDGQIRWDTVRVDTDGFPTACDQYDVEYIATDGSGTPVETDNSNSKVRHRGSIKVHVAHFRIVSGTDSSGNFTFGTNDVNDFKVGQSVIVSSVKPTAYNGTWTIYNIVDSKHFKVHGTTGVGDLSSPGLVEDNDDTLHAITHQLPKPKTWYWVARVRAHAGKCWSNWSDWTDPVLPWTGADPQPPVPVFTSVAFDRIGGKKHNAWRAAIHWNEVVNWDVPGGDRESDLSRYLIVAEVCEDPTATPKVWTRFNAKKVGAKDDDADDAHRVTYFSHLRRRNLYRFTGRSVDRFNRRSDFSAYYPSSSGVSILGTSAGPYDPQNVVTTHPAHQVLLTKWDPPDNSDDVDGYQIQVYRGYPSGLRETVFTRAHHHVYNVPNADEGTSHRVVVTAVDEDGNTSASVDPGSDTTATPMWVTPVSENFDSGTTPDLGTFFAGSLYSSLFSTATDDTDVTNHIEIIGDGTNKDRIRFTSAAGTANLIASGGGVQIGGGSAQPIGFYGAVPQSRPHVSGSTAGNAALQSLIAALGDGAGGLGLFHDTTT